MRTPAYRAGRGDNGRAYLTSFQRTPRELVGEEGLAPDALLSICPKAQACARIAREEAGDDGARFGRKSAAEVDGLRADHLVELILILQ